MFYLDMYCTYIFIQHLNLYSNSISSFHTNSNMFRDRLICSSLFFIFILQFLIISRDSLLLDIQDYGLAYLLVVHSRCHRYLINWVMKNWYQSLFLLMFSLVVLSVNQSLLDQCRDVCILSPMVCGVFLGNYVIDCLLCVHISIIL